MFKRKTLFVLGAGASYEVGLPVGVTLARTISHMLDVDPSSPVGGLLGQLYNQRRLSSNDYHRAAMQISKGVRFTNSIDDYLDRHSNDENIQLVGKLAIVKSILDAEANSLLVKNFRAILDKLEHTWYMKFFRMLGAQVNVSNVEQIFDNVAFIVFNYDRCLEHFLRIALQFTYNIKESEFAGILKKLKIEHPYGVAGPLAGPNSVPFGGPKSHDPNYVTLSADVKIFTEQITGGNVLKNVREMMVWAEQIVFLGFGYHELNLQLLKPKAKMNLKPVLGTAVEMSQLSIEQVSRQLAAMFSGSQAISSVQITDQSCAKLFDYHIKKLPN